MTRSDSFPAETLAGPPAAATSGITSAGAPVRIGAVALTVRDLDTVSRFYQQAIGLSVIETGLSLVRLGVGATVLLELHHDPDAALASRAAAGLFHTAFLLPSRADLAQWLLHAAELGVRLEGASDHLVSEAIYLSDPEGNGIEVYRDRPSESWPMRDGSVEMATLRLDLAALAASVPSHRWSGLPAGSSIGHVHLQVGELDASDRFYAGTLGLDIVCRYPGATFLSSGGYHHHLGTNIWNSRGAPVRTGRTTGLANVELAADRPAFEAVRARLSADEAGRADGAHLTLRDPWGTSITLVAR